MKFGQLIDYNKKNISLENSRTKCGGGTIPRPYSKKQNWAYLRINSLKFYAVCFYCMPTRGPSKDSKTKLKTT